MKTQCVEIGCSDPATTRVVLVDPCPHLSNGDYAGDAYYCDQHKEKLPPLFKARLQMVPSPGSAWKPEDDPPPFAIRTPLHPDKVFINTLRAQHGEFKVALRFWSNLTVRPLRSCTSWSFMAQGARFPRNV